MHEVVAKWIVANVLCCFVVTCPLQIHEGAANSIWFRDHHLIQSGSWNTFVHSSHHNIHRSKWSEGNLSFQTPSNLTCSSLGPQAPPPPSSPPSTSLLLPHFPSVSPAHLFMFMTWMQTSSSSLDLVPSIGCLPAVSRRRIVPLLWFCPSGPQTSCCCTIIKLGLIQVMSHPPFLVLEAQNPPVLQ